MLFACAALTAPASDAQDAPARVVLLYDERIELPGLAELDAAFAHRLRTDAEPAVEIFRESMDLSRFASAGYVEWLRATLRTKFRDKPIDVAVAVMDPALDFLLAEQPVFPNAAIVFCGIDERTLARNGELPPHVTGVVLKREFASTLELVLSTHPDTREIVLFSGISEFDRHLAEEAREEFRPFADRVRITELPPESLAAMLATVAHLPPHTIVLYPTMFRDGAGVAHVPHDVASAVSAAANVPVYGFVDQHLGRGIVGGVLYSLASHGEAAADLVREILRGRAPADLPLVRTGPGRPMFDWRQLRRWSISERQLPPDSSVRFRPPSPWIEYRGHVVGALAVLGLQSALIATLLWHRSRIRRAQAELQATRRRFQDLADAVPVLIWMATPDRRCSYVNHRWLDFTGSAPAGAIGEGWMDYIHPDDRPTYVAAHAAAFDARAPFEQEFRLRRKDGEYRWMLGQGVPRLTPAGQFLGYVGSCLDITDRKLGDEELRESRAELVHLARASSLGVLSSALAHELNQPLGAILSNAQAALKFLARPRPPLEDVTAILRDIVTEDQRAGEVIRRMRQLLKRGPLQFAPIDLNQLVAEVLRLMHAELRHRGVHVDLETADALPQPSGNRVPLQQVIINLLLNACEAMQHLPSADRRIVIRTCLTGANEVAVAVADRGIGLTDEQLARLFSPFRTTKPQGLGIGLVICKSIAGAHGGRLWAENNRDGGATFHLVLPLAPERDPALARSEPLQSKPSAAEAALP